jgi:hypothetical protein
MSDPAIPSSRPDPRITADEVLVKALHKEGFEGPAWNCFAEDLARYSHPIIKTWILSSKIFLKCSEKGVKCTGPPRGSRRVSNDDAAEMANETIARALYNFRDKVLRPGKWSPQGGASLATMFITQCLFQFPNVYRHWLLEVERVPIEQLTVDKLEELEYLKPVGAHDTLIELRDEIAHALEHYVKDKRVHYGLILRGLGFSRAECAEMLGITVKALDSAVQRHWRNLIGKRRR